MSKLHNILPVITSFYISSARKSRVCRNSKKKVFRVAFQISFSYAGDSNIKILPSHTVVFNENAIFEIIFIYLKQYPIKLPQNNFDSFNCVN